MLVKFKDEKIVFFRGTSTELRRFIKQYKKIKPEQQQATPEHNVVGFHQKTITENYE